MNSSEIMNKIRKIIGDKRSILAVIKLYWLNITLTLVATSLVLPFAWMILTSLKSLDEIGLENWIPSLFHWENYPDVFNMEKILFSRWYLNSIFVAAWVTFLQVFTSSLAAFSFSRIQWPGRDKVFVLYLSTMMLPGLVMMIPNYSNMIAFGMIDTYIGLILPAAFSAFGTFLMRQFMMNIPRSLDEAAEIDGANKWQLYWNVILPLSRPATITLVIFTFMGNYQNLFWPLVMIKSDHRYTLPIGMLFFDGTQGQQTNYLMAAVAMSVVPMILVFIFLQKRLVKGIMMGAVKG